MRCTHIPLQYILGNQYFYGRKFEISKDVLIPRADSETLIDCVLELFPNKEVHLKILEVGVGSGCLIITLLKEFPNAEGIGLDISQNALNIASKNGEIHQINHRCNWIQCDIQNLKSQEISFPNLDILISNPPYIKTKEIQTLQKEVKDFEPHLALDGGEDGLKFYPILEQIGYLLLKKDGLLVVEVGHDQSKAVQDIFSKRYKILKVCKDLGNIERCIIAQKINQ